MNKTIRILHLEDLQSDADLVAREIKKGNILHEILWVANEADYRKALTEFVPDIILCDHSLPSYTSQDALNDLSKRGIRIPFILITATMSEEFVVKMIKEGVDDYILKDRLQRLPSAILNSIERVTAENDKERYLNEIISQEKKFRALIDNLSEALILINEDLEIIYRSPSAERITGFNLGEMGSKTFLNLFHPEDLYVAKDFFKIAASIPGIPVQKTFRIVHKDGRTIWLEGTITNLLKDKNVKGYIINYRDITERKNVELEKEKMTIDLLQHNKNLEQFAYIISHNLRSPVANIIGLSNMVQSTPQMSKADFKRCMEGLALSVKRLDDTIIDLNYILQVRREINEKKEPVRFSGLVKDIKASISDIIESEQINIKMDFIDVNELFTIKSYLNSIFYNLISNSIKYRCPKRPSYIKISAKKYDSRILLSFKDNGLGIDLEAHEGKMFGLYKKFHAHIEGKGMGLYMVKTQVEILGGKISVKSKVNEGTEFLIEFKV